MCPCEEKFWLGKTSRKQHISRKTAIRIVALLTMSTTRAYPLGGTQVMAIASNLYRPIRMEAVVVTRSKHRREALEFLRFAASPPGQAIFTRYGFREPKGPAVRRH